MDWFILWDYREDLLNGMLLTAELSVVSIIAATLVGVLAGCMRAMPSFFIRRIGNAYAEIFRNTPILVKLFFLHFVLDFDALAAGFGALVLHQSSYISDYTLAGFRSVPPGQLEAAQSTGISYAKAIWYIIIPQAIRPVIPPFTIQYIQVVKDSSIVSIIAVYDIMYVINLINNDTFRAVESAVGATLIYLSFVAVVVVSMSILQSIVDRKFHHANR